MIDYTPTSQLKIERFYTPFGAKLASNNRWVALAKLIPWDELAQVYYQHLQADSGRKSLHARIAIGAMIIKHKLNLSDRETIAIISENPYMQHFLGLDVFVEKPLFDASLFVRLRKRMGQSTFDKFNQIIIKRVSEHTSKGSKRKKKPKDVKDQEEGQQETTQEEQERDKLPPAFLEAELKVTGGEEQVIESTKASDQACGPILKGKLKLDATVADIYIKYPTDLDLLAKSRIWSEKIIDKLCERLCLTSKPRTYRRIAHKAYLSVIKKKKKSKKALRSGIREQLNYLKRNLGHISKLLSTIEEGEHILAKNYQRYYKVIKQVYQQQKDMYEEKRNSCPDRIVSLDQPYVRPILRGKSKGIVEFGPKLGISLVEGYARIDTMSWSAYHEGKEDFKKSIERYCELYGYYPELVQVDQLYASRENRRWAKEKGIRITAKPLGRPKKEAKSSKETAVCRRKQRQEHVERNEIEGKIGQGKQGYRLNQIRTKTQATAASWISCIIFVMNLVRFSADMSKKRKNKKKYFLCFINFIFYGNQEEIYMQQNSSPHLALPYAA